MQFRKGFLLTVFPAASFLMLQPFAGLQAQQDNARTDAGSHRAALLDWTPREEMTQEQQALLPATCCGGFVEPEQAVHEDTDQPPENSPTHFTTAEGIDESEPGLYEITGDVTLQQGYRTLRNNGSTVLDQEAETVDLIGDVVFREPGILLTGSSAFVDQGSNKHQVDEAGYVLHQSGIHGAAGNILYNSESGQITIDNGQFSRCEPGDEFWMLEARHLDLDRESGIGRATAVSLRLKDVPVFYYPFTLPFPLDDRRMSGFLAPSLGSTDDGGVDFALPYYFNIAPHHDATVTPRLMTDRGLLTSAELRYLGPWYRNTANLAYMHNDRLYDEATADIPGDDSPPVDKRWFLGYEHQGNLGTNWSTLIDYNAVSDVDYFLDFGSTGLNAASRTHLNREGRLNYHSENWRAGARVQQLEIIDPFIGHAGGDIYKPFDRLPEFTLGADYGSGSLLRYGFDSSFVSFGRDLNPALLSPTQIENGALVEGNRASVEPSLSLPLRSAGAFVMPTVKYNYTSYELEDQAFGTEDSPERSVATASMDSGLIFERPLTLAGNAFSQTLEPRLYYLYSEFEEQGHLPNFDTSELNFSFSQLFRDDRFSGGDRIADANQLTFAVTSRFLDYRGEERARASLGQIFYFDDRKVTLDSPLHDRMPVQAVDTSRSALVGELAYSFNDNWRLYSDLQWNQDRDSVDEGRFQFQYQSDLDHIVNIGWHYRRTINEFRPIAAGIDPRIRQTDLSGVWPVNNNWRLLGRWNYDHSNSRNLETFAGVEYSNCCATIRLIGREWIDDDEFFLAQSGQKRGIFLQVSLNGLGDITGGGISRLLSDGILGFKEYQQ